MCLDWSGVELQGEDPAYNTKTIDVMFIPCNMKETLLGDATEDDRIPQNCNYDKDKLIEYLGPIQMLIYKNIGSFQQDEYGNERVKKESSISRIQVDEYRPSWINTKISNNVLYDETQFI